MASWETVRCFAEVPAEKQNPPVLPAGSQCFSALCARNGMHQPEDNTLYTSEYRADNNMPSGMNYAYG